ncbi:MAG: Undecaprenyl-phosphate mannosyltransferase [Firmicutes bacterium ADurb.Bin193]|nr:MAG: Undecaprenyl-phosphate mannosyltransferase [Firmicutes bacterium ADurb.Bin193]
MKKLIIIPVYNEEKNIGHVLNGIKKTCPDIDVLVIDDGSSDDSYRVCVESGVGEVIKLPANLGIGGARQTGFKYALYNDYDIVIQMDGDGQHDPACIEKMISQLRDGANLCIGSRFITGEGFQSSFVRRIGISFIYNIIRFVLGQKITDPTSGYRACDKKAIALFAKEYPQDYPEPESLVTAGKNNLIIKEIPVTMMERKNGKSTIGGTDSVYYMIKVTLAILIDAMTKK